MAYNDIYERLVDNEPNQIRGLVAYGLYKAAKRQWVQQHRQANNRSPTPGEIKAYVATYTPAIVDGLQNQADSVLAAFGDQVVKEARPAIVEDVLRGSFWKAVLTGLFTNFAYTVILLLVVWVLARSGVDILGIAKTGR